MTTKTAQSRVARRTCGLLAALLGTVALAAGCDVTNPGPVQDSFLNLPEAHQALVNGAGAKFVVAISNIINHTAFAARELFPTGNCCGNPNQTPLEQAGHFIAAETDIYWSPAHQARWIAEDAVRRFTALGAAKVNAQTFTQAYLWAGFANRLLGENMCEAVFDGGAKQANIEYFKRAETAFTNAIAMGTGDSKVAGYAGRASVRVWLKDWAAAVSDAQQVPQNFVYTVATDPSNQTTENNVWFNDANSPYRSYSSFATWYLDYYNQTGDPRVSIGSDPKITVGNATLTGYGLVPWFFQQKYTKPDAPFKIASGREMVLIRAEAALVGNDMQTAMGLINSLRTDQISKTTGKAVPPWTAATMADAWTALKRERAIELWLEARRMGDLRRWKENGTPGSTDFPNWEVLSTLFKDNPPSDCIPISQTEIDTNPNF